MIRPVRIRELYEDMRSSLFWVPAFYIGTAILLAVVAALIDAEGRLTWAGLLLFEADAESARNVLQTVATATITVAGLVFPVMVVALQLASSQFSPRVLRGFLRDRVIQHVLGVVIGTFSFSVITLANTDILQGREAGEVSPSFTVTVATVLAIASALAIVQFIHHAARYMQVVEIIRRTTQETRSLIAKVLPPPGEHHAEPTLREAPDPSGPSRTVRAINDGWVQQIDGKAILAALPDRAIVRIDTIPGAFVVEGQPLCTIWADSSDRVEDLPPEVLASFAFGSTRTMQQDIVYGIRQIVDIALRALSPAVNDPTTAYEVTVNLGAILRDLLLRQLPPRVETDERDRTLLRPHELTHADYVAHAFDQLRLSAAPHPVASINILDTIGTLVSLLRDADLDDRVEPLERKVRLVVAAVEATDPLPEDLEKVRAAADRALEVRSPAPAVADHA